MTWVRCIRIPLRLLLACLAVSLAAIGAVAVGLAKVSATRGYLMRRADEDLLACARSMLSHRFVAAPSSTVDGAQRKAIIDQQGGSP